MQLEDLEVYSLAMELGKNCWNIVCNWNHFEKQTIGSQWIRAIDSVAANISEGWGRYSYKDSRNFLFIARGSLYESRTWLSKALERNLVTKEIYDCSIVKYDKLGVKLNNYITVHNKQMQNKQ